MRNLVGIDCFETSLRPTVIPGVLIVHGLFRDEGVEGATACCSRGPIQLRRCLSIRPRTMRTPVTAPF